MKKFLIVLILLLLLVGCRKTDSILFKNEFEALNINEEYKEVSIPSDNPFIYISDLKLIEKMENKEDMIVLFGYSKSNDTRNILSYLLDECKNNNIDKIYYLDILDMRDEKNVEDDGSVSVIKEGSANYNKILELLGDNATNYIIRNKNVGKRIYAPSILVIKNNNMEFKNIKSYLETEEEQINEVKEMLNKIVKSYNSNSCSTDEGC